jgi:hypothetical protein
MFGNKKRPPLPALLVRRASGKARGATFVKPQPLSNKKPGVMRGWDCQLHSIRYAQFSLLDTLRPGNGGVSGQNYWLA